MEYPSTIEGCAGDILEQMFGTNSSGQNWTSLYNKSLHIAHERAEKANDVTFWQKHNEHLDFFDNHTFMTVNKKGELLFISFCVDMLKRPAVDVLLEHPKRVLKNKGTIYRSLEHFKNNY